MDLKYLLKFVIFFVILGVGVLVYQYWWLPREEAKKAAQAELEAIERLVEELETVSLTDDEGVEGEGELPDSEEDSQKTLSIITLEEGSGVEAKAGDMVTVHYTGTLVDGTKFDSSLDRGEPFSFVLGGGQVITGWEIGVLGMKVGEKRKLAVPPGLGYGESGTPGGTIPPNAALIFEIELLAIEE